MQVTLNPVLTDLERIRLGSWLIATLSSEKLDNNIALPLSDRINIYHDNVPYRLTVGVWQFGDYSHQIFLARPGGSDVSLRERLSVLLCLSQLCEQSTELVSACSTVITRYLLGEHRELSSSLVSASVPVSGLAFSSERVASLLDGVWLLPSGEEVDVSGPEWTVCATDVPAISVEISNEAIQALPATTAIVSPQFTVGQRVHWTPTDEDHNAGYGPGDGVIISDRSVAGYYRLRMDDGRMSEPLATLEELSALPVQFVVGQRVHWIPSGEDAAAGITECDGEIIHIFVGPQGTDGYTHTLRTANSNEWHAEAEDLRAL